MLGRARKLVCSVTWLFAKLSAASDESSEGERDHAEADRERRRADRAGVLARDGPGQAHGEQSDEDDDDSRGGVR